MRSPARSSTILFLSELIGPQSIHNDLGFQIPNLDASISGSAQPVPVGREDKGVDDLTSIEGVKALAFVQVPEHGSAVLATRGTEGTIRGNTDGVEVASVADKVVAELAVGQSPNLDKTVPSAGNDEGHALARAETDAGHPLGVTLISGSNGVFAFTQGVPKLDGLVTRSTDNLTVVDTECHGEDILGVSNKTTRGASRVDLPKTKGTIPTSRKGKLSITRDDDITHEVGMSPQGTLGVTVRVVLAGVGVSETPDQDGLIARGGEDEVGILGGGGDAGDPVAVAAESSSKAESFRHD